MKIAHRKTLWLHTAFSFTLCALIATLILAGQQIPLFILLIFIAVYIGGNVFIHVKRGDLKKETIYEYTLTGLVLLIVLGSALK
jgi:hypothetical protein